MDIQPLINALRQQTGSDVQIHDIDGVKHAAVPDGLNLTRLDLEKFLPAPLATARDVTAHDVRGLVDYVNKFKAGATQLYCTAPTDPSVIARLDDHAPGQPSHVRHTARFQCPRSAEWTTWTKANKAAMPQKEFAEFLETNLRDIREPNGSDMLVMVSNFRDVTTATFESKVNRTNGKVHFQYIEDDKPGLVTLPEVFKIGIPVFEGMPAAYAVSARLRWRLADKDGKKTLFLSYDLDRPDVILRAAYDELLAHVEQETGLRIFRAL